MTKVFLTVTKVVLHCTCILSKVMTSVTVNVLVSTHLTVIVGRGIRFTRVDDRDILVGIGVTITERGKVVGRCHD